MQAASNTLLAFSDNAPLKEHGNAPNSASSTVQSKVMARLRNPHAHQSTTKTPQGPFWTRGVSAEHAFSRAEVRPRRSALFVLRLVCVYVTD